MAESRRDKGTGTLFQRADGTWVGGLEIPTSDGKRRRKTVSSKRRDDVVRRLRELRKDIDAGRVSTSPSVSVARYLHDWLKLVVRPNAAPKTYAWYEQAVRLHIIPHIGAKRIEKLTPADIRMLHERVADAASTSSAQHAHITLRTALSRAVKDGMLVRNVAAIAGKPGHNATQRGAYTFEQAKAIINAAIATGDDMWAARVIAAFFTGARPAELLGLRWEYVDLKTGTITLAWQLQLLPSEHGCDVLIKSNTHDDVKKPSCGRKRAIDCPAATFRLPRGFRHEPCTGSLAFVQTKTKTVRVVPLAAPLWAILRALSTAEADAEADEPTNPYDLVFHHPDGRPIQPKDDYRAWKDLLGSISGLPANAVPYSSRHTTATLLRGLGISEETRMSILGHSTATAHAGYVHYDDIEDNRAALASLTDLLKG